MVKQRFSTKALVPASGITVWVFLKYTPMHLALASPGLTRRLASANGGFGCDISGSEPVQWWFCVTSLGGSECCGGGVAQTLCRLHSRPSPPRGVYWMVSVCQRCKNLAAAALTNLKRLTSDVSTK